MKKTSVFATVLLVLFALIVLAAALYVFGPLYPDGRGGETDSRLSDWMGTIDGEKRLSEINIPGRTTPPRSTSAPPISCRIRIRRSRASSKTATAGSTCASRFQRTAGACG